MASNNNGFADMLKEMKTLLNVDQKVSLDIMEEAANYFVEKLKPRIPLSNRNTRHLRDQLEVVVKDDMVQVTFGDDGWYWYLVEHGHLVATPRNRLKRRKNTTRIARSGKGKKRVKGLHFVQNTWDADGDKVADLIAEKIIKKMEG